MRRILRDTYLNIFGRFKKRASGVHIINSHFITTDKFRDSDEKIFEKFISRIINSSDLMRIEDASELIANNNIPKNESYVAFTFDDGYEECYSAIAPVLDKYSCNAAFFINANYVESDSEYRAEYHKRVEVSSKTPLSWEQIKQLHNSGHIIGSHGLDHFNFAKISEEEINSQLLSNKNILEKHLSYRCDYFAWTYGKNVDFNEYALLKSLENHKYVFSGTDYKNYFGWGGRVLNRRHLEPYWPKSHIDYFLSYQRVYNL